MPEASVPKIGRYSIVSALGRGSMGVVYLAEDPMLDRRVALKTIDLTFAVPAGERAAFEQRFLAEARIAARLSHPGIVVVHDMGHDADATLYIAMEYLEGRTLAEVIESDAPLEWREALRLVAATARALHHAHGHGVVHRDVKPANVMLLASGEVKIMDFGIAKVPNMQLTSAGQLFGTPLFMSPEQAAGREVDHRADLFALGAIAYALLTGKHAFRAENPLQVLARVVNDDPEPPSALVAALPPQLDTFIRRALAKDPAARYPDGETMAREAQSLIAGIHLARTWWRPETERDRPAPEAVEASAGVPPRPRRPNAKGRGWLLAAGAAAVLAAGALSVWQSEAPPAPSPRARPAAQARDSAANRAPRRPAAGGRLAIDFEHRLKDGRLRVWLDESLVVDQALDSRVTRKVLSFTVRKGGYDEVLEVAPGLRTLKIELRSDGKLQTRSTSAVFAADATRTLRIRLSRLRGELWLEWA